MLANLARDDVGMTTSRTAPQQIMAVGERSRLRSHGIPADLQAW
jgi:hypothetical protein